MRCPARLSWSLATLFVSSAGTLGGCSSSDSGNAPSPGGAAAGADAGEADEGNEDEAQDDNAQADAAEGDEAGEEGPFPLTAADGVKIYGEFYPGPSADAPIVLLFHQAGWNAGEYDPIAPRVQSLGFAALAIDQRSGGARDGRENRTVLEHEASTSFIEAYPDLEAALAWAKTQPHSRVLAWGSSYSAALVFKLGSEHGDDLHALLSFSPGEYIDDDGTVAGWSSKVTLPIFVTSAPNEVADAKAVLDASPSEDKVQFEPEIGKHGSSILREDKNPEGFEAAWTEVETFLARHRG